MPRTPQYDVSPLMRALRDRRAIAAKHEKGLRAAHKPGNIRWKAKQEAYDDAIVLTEMLERHRLP